MKPEAVDAIHDMTLKARTLLMTEISEQLEGLYGFLPSGQCRPAAEYLVLTGYPTAAETRHRLETLLADELQAGLTAQQAREKLVKEAAFTWLNRLVAFKMMETRRLLRQTVTRGHNSNGFMMWLTEPDNEEHYRDYEAGDLPQDGLGEGPRQRAYHQFLLAQCARLAQEVHVLFEPDNLPSRLCPRPRALSQLIDLLNNPQLQEAWQPGSEETIGWVYQTFNAEELERAFREVRVAKKKFEASDIPSVTQLFTPRWIVRFLVENTLGRMWMNMHPDSQLGAKLEYLVPENNSRPMSLKSVRDIRLLDPACGTMHFGLLAFDVFAEMYREEMANAGQPGWPQTPPLDDESQIPAAIVAHNIYGIDIDLRAVQLSALTLYLKAKTLSPQARLRESRLACADIHMLDGDRLQEFLTQMGLQGRPIYGRVLAALQHRLKDAEQLGSLLRLDEEIRALVEQERQRYEQEGRQFSFPGWSQAQFETEAGRREFWEILEIQIGQALDAFARERVAAGQDHSFFAGETTKGLQLLEIMSKRYDVVVTNPPYMSAQKMNPRLKKLVSDAYPAGKGDLYAAFIQRCIEFSGQHGRVGMLTIHSFMFISSYENLRSYIRERMTIGTLIHAGPGLFAVGNPGTLQTAAYVLSRESNEQLRNDSIGMYFRLVNELNGEAKQQRFEQALSNLGTSKPDTVIFRYRQNDFDAIPGRPWIYHLPDAIVKLFYDNRSLTDVACTRAGMHGGNRFRFARLWWEVGLGNTEWACTNEREFVKRGNKWSPYVKGGSFRKWWGNQEWVVTFDIAHQKILADCGNRLPSREFYFRPMIACSKVTSSKVSFRFYSQGFIFADAVSCVFSDSSTLYALLGVLNSSFCCELLRATSPTVNFEAGHLARIPVPTYIPEILKDYVLDAIKLSVYDSQEDESTWEFVAPPSWHSGIDETTSRRMQLASIEHKIDEEVYRLYGILDEDRVAIEVKLAELSTSTDLLDEDASDTDSSDEDSTEAPPAAQITQDELARQWISYAVGIVMGRFQPGIDGALGRGHFSSETSAKLRSLADSDGILVLDQGHPDDIATRVLQALQLMLNCCPKSFYRA